MKKVKPIPAGRHKKERGSKRMREFGYRKVEIWLDKDECALIDRAARRDGKRLATWVREICKLAAADPIYKRP